MGGERLADIEARFAPDEHGDEHWTVKDVRRDVPALVAEVRRLKGVVREALESVIAHGANPDESEMQSLIACVELAETTLRSELLYPQQPKEAAVAATQREEG